METEDALLTSSTQADTISAAVALGQSSPLLDAFRAEGVHDACAALIYPNWFARDLWCTYLRSRCLRADVVIARLAFLRSIDECLTRCINN